MWLEATMLLGKVNTISKVSSVKGAIRIISIDQFTMLAIRRLVKSVFESLLYYFNSSTKAVPSKPGREVSEWKSFALQPEMWKGMRAVLQQSCRRKWFTRIDTIYPTKQPNGNHNLASCVDSVDVKFHEFSQAPYYLIYCFSLAARIHVRRVVLPAGHVSNICLSDLSINCITVLLRGCTSSLPVKILKR